MNTAALETVFAYHEATKHHFHAFAPGPGYLDWATQPDPFRRYAGAPLIQLARCAPKDGPPYEAGFCPGLVGPAALDHASISQLFFDTLALSAWKEYRGSRWALRVNPSSGNLHPTEGYLICGPVPGLCEMPMVAHYAPREHALEVRATFPRETWRALVADLPPSSLLVGFTSIHWREAWKYGERAYRYCQHDVGHALAALCVAAGGLGWQATLLDGLGSDQLAALLGVADVPAAGGRAAPEVEREHPDCLVAVYPQGGGCTSAALPPDIVREFAALRWLGTPNTLSSGHVEWPWVEAVAEATVRPAAAPGLHGVRAASAEAHPPPADGRPVVSLPLRPIIHRRRSAQQMDGHTRLDRDAFYRILGRTMPGTGHLAFGALPWEPHVHLALFVHRVADLAPGLYLLVRDPARTTELRAELRAEFAWEAPEGCPPGLPLHRLVSGDLRAVARRISCTQDIASDGCFSLGMITEFEGPLQEHGAWFYPRLFWECGMIGQVLYLEAEAAGVRGTGIGCFFDDAMHTVLGLRGARYQSLYHFTVGGALEDPRLTTLPPYGEDRP